MENLELAVSLRVEKRIPEAIEVLGRLLAASPENAEYNYQMAWCHDLLGKEVEAVPFYEKAIKGGLNSTELQGAYLGLGSTLRTIGEYKKSKDILSEGIARFPEKAELRVFLAMTLYNLNSHKEAMEILLNLLCDTTQDKSILSYERAIRFYADKLDEKW